MLNMAKAKTAKQKNTPLNIDLQWLGQRIKIARLLSGYSKSQDFRNIVFPDYTVSLYYQWEIGKRKPGDEALKSISEFCKINYDWLKTGDGDPFKGIKISSKEKNLKKAMIAYEMINKKFELEKQRAKTPAPCRPDAGAISSGIFKIPGCRPRIVYG